MSSAQTQILEGIETRIGKVLTTAWKRLNYSYELEKNDFRTIKRSFGIGAGSGSTVDGTVNAVTMDQEFFVVLATNHGNRKDDSSEREALNEIYDNLESLYRDFFISKLDTNNLVLTVSAFDLDEPERPADNVISVRASFTVKHRKSTT
jgi:hypothetical protein